MSDVNSRPPRSSTQEVTPFEPFGKPVQITVSIVMVPPQGESKAWGHTEKGACVEFTGTRQSMLNLYQWLRSAGRDTPPASVVVSAADWQDLHEISRGECPIHVLPEIEPGSAIAFAPY